MQWGCCAKDAFLGLGLGLADRPMLQTSDFRGPGNKQRKRVSSLWAVADESRDKALRLDSRNK